MAPDPWVASVAILVAGAAAGVVAVTLGWRGAAARVGVADQLPYIVSGAMGGLALLGFTLGVLVIQTRRRVEAHRRLELERLTLAVEHLASVVRGRIGE